MDRIYSRIAFCIVIVAGVVCVSGSAIPAADRVLQKPLTAMLDCPPLDSALINAGLPCPVVDTPDSFTGRIDADGMCVHLSWQPVVYPSVAFYYVQGSRKPTFDTIRTCDYVAGDSTTVFMHSTVEDTLWFRVCMVDIDADNQYHFGPFSDPPMPVVFDITKPKLTITVTPIPTVSDGRLQVRVDFDGVELYPDSLILSEDTTFNHAQSFSIEASSGTKVLTLSYDEERKVIYGKMIDKAGNASNVAADTISAGSHSHNYPNPFNPKEGPTNLVFYLTADQADQEIMVYIYDLFGNLVKKWRVDSPRTGANDGGESANTSLQWDGCNQDGMTVADGGYICVIKAGDEILSRHKIAVAK